MCLMEDPFQSVPITLHPEDSIKFAKPQCNVLNFVNTTKL